MSTNELTGRTNGSELFTARAVNSSDPFSSPVFVSAAVTAVNDRLITFTVEAHDGIDQIGVGTHVRAVIDQARFEQRMEVKRSDHS